MTAQRIDGKILSAEVRESVKSRVATLKERSRKVPGLAVVLVGSDPASEVYVRNKGKQTTEVGMNSFEHKLADTITQEELIAKVEELNNDENVHGILVQLPLPSHMDEAAVINTIAPAKDVDGFHVVNSGLLATGQDSLVPCTPSGCMIMLEKQLGKDLSGLHAVVIGRSNIVGKPMASLLLKANATVTVVHSRTKNIEALCQQADILVAAVGRPKMVKKSWIKEGATIIDVGINRIEVDGKNKLVGDVDYEDVLEKASAITPVPGGVGPMTIACLLDNTVRAFCAIENIEM